MAWHALALMENFLPSFLPSLAAGAKGKGKGTGGKRKAEAAPAAAKKGRAKKA
jgi:hypothetical protein